MFIKYLVVRRHAFCLITLTKNWKIITYVKMVLMSNNNAITIIRLITVEWFMNEVFLFVYTNICLQYWLNIYRGRRPWRFVEHTFSFFSTFPNPDVVYVCSSLYTFYIYIYLLYVSLVFLDPTLYAASYFSNFRNDILCSILLKFAISGADFYGLIVLVQLFWLHWI